MEKIEKITDCFFHCPFFGSTMDGMQCNHPYWDDIEDAYANMIIDQNNSRDGKIPPLCPLRQEDLTIKYQLVLKNDGKKRT